MGSFCDKQTTEFPLDREQETRLFFKRVLGLPLGVAQEVAKQEGYIIRETYDFNNNEDLIGTLDFAAARLNVATKDGIIVKYMSYG
jgi:hypothetical protein